MSTISTNPTAGLSPSLAARGGSGLASADNGWGGLTRSAWIKIGIVAGLMALLFRFNLSRLWLKTNPITGQENWGHAFFIPLIGLYYLYVHREELVAARTLSAPKASTGLFWGILQLGVIAVGILIWAALPQVFGFLDSSLSHLGLLTQYHGWGVSGLYLYLPFLIVSSIAVVLVLPRRVAQARRLSGWAESAAIPLIAWCMSALMAWGALFFVYVIAPSIFAVLSPALAIVCLLSLAGVVWVTARTSDGRVSALADRMLARSPAWLGGFILVWGVLFSVWGIYPGQNDFFKDVGMVVAVFGVVLLLTDWRVMRVAWFPILFLFCGLPWPDQVYSWVAGPLQHLAAAVAVRFLSICNIPSTVAGTKIIMFVDPTKPPRILNVEEACAGLRSLMTFVALAGGWAFVFMSSRPLWHRLIQTASAVPIAIFCNVMRVSITGLTDKYWGHEFSEGFAHRFVGLLLLVPAFFLILLVGWVLDNLFIEEVDEKPQNAGASGQQRPRPAGALPGKKVVLATRTAASPGAAGGTRQPAVPSRGPGGNARQPVSGAKPVASTVAKQNPPAGPRQAASARPAPAPSMSVAQGASAAVAPARKPALPVQGAKAAAATPRSAAPAAPASSPAKANQTPNPAAPRRPSQTAPAKPAQNKERP